MAMSSRAIAPVIGVIGMLAVVTVLGGITAAIVPETVDGIQDHEQMVIDLAVTEQEGDWKLTLTHQGGDALPVEAIDLVISVDGIDLDHQPDVPFFSQTGFESGPGGVFNEGSADDTWHPGDSPSVTVYSSTNSPQITVGSTVTVEVYRDGQLIASASALVSR